MKIWKVLLPVAAVLLLAGQAAAQTEEQERLREAEVREAEMDRRLAEAEERMAEAARQIAEITSERLPRVVELQRRVELSNKPRLGVTIDSGDTEGPVEGVAIVGVTPGSAAAEAGLRSGDVMTAVNDESLSADNSQLANERLLDFMQGVEEGDVLKVEYLRDGKVGSVEVEPRVLDKNMFVWMDGDGRNFTMPRVPELHVAPEMVEKFKMEFAYPWMGTGLRGLELVELNEGLGRYFGTDTGLLVISAPKSAAFELEDGDVIQNIDGREPKDVRHAMRILSSYQGGETLKLGIMRDKKKRTLEVEIPADYHGKLFEKFIAPSPAAAPLAPLPPRAGTVIERT